MAGPARPVGVFRSHNKGCLYVLGATIGLAIVAQVLLELHVVPLTPRIRRHFLPLFQSKSYSERFDGELGPDEKISIGLIVPFTAKGQTLFTEASDADADPANQLVVLKMHFQSVLDTIRTKGDVRYHMYFAIDANEQPLSRRAAKVLAAAQDMAKGYPMDVTLLKHNSLKCLTQMFNFVTWEAYKAGHDYFALLNDDIRLDDGWSEAALMALRGNPFMRDFGIAGPWEYWHGLKSECTQFPVFSRLHVDIMLSQPGRGVFCDEEAFCSYGLDTAVCNMYVPFSSSFYLADLTFYNKVGLDGELKVPTIGRRYSVAAGWEAKIAATQSLWFHAVMDWIDEHRDPGSRRYRRDRHSGPDPTGRPPMRKYLPTSEAAA